jgi:glycerol-3-phosphate dehydrogenase
MGMNMQTEHGRQVDFKRLTGEALDVLVIGGGIVGAGVARDAAMRGLKTGLVDQHDFASGTSGRSSRLLHGGIRYLAQGRIGLVHEASAEKRILHDIAPHLAQPLAFIFPTYPGTDWPLWQLRIGVKIYDLLCGGRNFGRSRALNKAETKDAVPGLNGTGLTGSVRYFDALTNDARLVLDTLRSASRHGAAVINYCRFENAERDADRWRCRLTDVLTGSALEVRARTVVNASGPWAARLPHSQVKLRLTKGIHLVMERGRLPVRNAVVLTQGKRILFVIPWGERIILGTTDTDYDGAPEGVRVEAADITYLLGVANEFFPAAKLARADILSSWAGLRPLLADKRGAASDISRAHQIREPEPGWRDVAGGKLTTYRLMAEQTVDRILAATNGAAAACETGIKPLLDKPEPWSGILPPPFCREAVEHYCAEEWTLGLADLMVRRTGWHYYDAKRTAKAKEAAQWLKEILGWTASTEAAELARYMELVQQTVPESSVSR